MKDFYFNFDSKSCEQCNGFCCRGKSGYIFVRYAEIEALAQWLKIDIQECMQKYIKKVGYRFSFIEKQIIGENGSEFACIFFDEQKERCSIYESRPSQCKTFPYWEQLKKITIKEAQKECPYIQSL
ncbi:hypothetical protein CCZ01_02740 [Helicobacter monodelphidis]|uniref:YkgJ family cysteine cluster protein n=1 Tax=Helicobacter sp. 15-1451 TaxID=2004995 RepID=UPI000DCCAE90|nr:YkgJ family cysteine cluster protein [Helicobacter sp. 15-1451]RAX58351.1 hypothetical protein CCZ01_02740 [Helicobacter sp. 15-1451]